MNDAGAGKMSAAPDEDLLSYMSEKQAYEHYGHLLTDKELRRARQGHKIEYFAFEKGIFYLPRQINDYLASKRVTKCSANAPLAEIPEENVKAIDSSRLADNGFKRKRPDISLVAGIAPQLARSAADRLEQKTLKPQK